MRSPDGQPADGEREVRYAGLEDDVILRKQIAELEEPINFIFCLANRFGFRTGEAKDLRMSDLSFVDEGIIRVRFSYDGSLKEDKRGEGRVKWGSAPEDWSWPGLRRGSPSS